LEDKYVKPSGTVFMSGVQTLVRLPLLQRELDRARGLRTAGFISGYRGSPLGGYDLALQKAQPHLLKSEIRFEAGMNEELAATAIWGTQQVNLYPGATVEGVFSIWYGKGPGVDRSGDAIKHGNMAGTAPNGGVLLLVGDDHGAKSSTIAHQSDQTLVACMVPVLNPASIEEYLEYGLFGFALSRYAGCWVAMKAISDTVDCSTAVTIDPARFSWRLPENPVPPGRLHIQIEEGKLAQEKRALVDRLQAVRAFARANRFDRAILTPQRPLLGIVTTGKAHLDLLRAFEMLGLGEAQLASLGIGVYKVGLTWPLEPTGIARFATEYAEVLVVEEKRALIEEQIKGQLFNVAKAPQRIVGKSDEHGAPLLPHFGELSPLLIARALIRRLALFGDTTALETALKRYEAIEQSARVRPVALKRNPFFCAGCPHNTSTRLPEGSRGMAGIGCHAMARWMDHLNTKTVTQMGGEGVNWIGHAPFTTEQHVFQNLGDGTYYHSGLMAIRAAIGARAQITYKLLYNAAVAMTGGQAVEGGLSPVEISNQLWAEGVAKVAVVTDEPDKYSHKPGSHGTDPSRHWAPGVTIHPREELVAVETMLRDTPGVTALIYDQTCAAEKRRRRKRGAYPLAPERVFINHRVCEGCGDCSIQSHCIGVRPLETELGHKRTIDQSVCNTDFSCLKGFCPSFVSVAGAAVRRPLLSEAAATFAKTPEPTVPTLAEPFSIFVAGIGGTGVGTIGALIGVAAQLESKGVTVLDVTGLSQKNGGVTSHIRLAPRQDQLSAPRISTGGADVVLASDLVVAVESESLAIYDPTRTRAVVNSNITPTSQFVTDPDADFDSRPLLARLAEAVQQTINTVEASEIATQFLGDAIGANLLLVGYAWQKGLIPLSREALLRAIELNGVAVAMNRAAFEWGRVAAHDPAAVEDIFPRIDPTRAVRPAQTLDVIVAQRRKWLAEYQNDAYAQRYNALVEDVNAAEHGATGTTTLTEAVARYAYKLMAYKDEYEVARLYADGEFSAAVQRQFEGSPKLTFHLSPPLIAASDPSSGRPRKIRLGPWMMRVFRLLRRMKGLRGTWLDVFGYTAERRSERRLRDEYEQRIRDMLPTLSAANLAAAVDIATWPEQIRGFGVVKQTSLERAERELPKLLAALHGTKGGIV